MAWRYFFKTFIRHNFLSSAVFSFQNQLFFQRIISVGPDLGQNCLEKVSADDKSTQINGHSRNIASFRLKRVYKSVTGFTAQWYGVIFLDAWKLYHIAVISLLASFYRQTISFLILTLVYPDSNKRYLLKRI